MAGSITRSFVMIWISLSRHVLLYSYFPFGKPKTEIPLELREVLQPKAEQFAPGLEKNPQPFNRLF